MWPTFRRHTPVQDDTTRLQCVGLLLVVEIADLAGVVPLDPTFQPSSPQSAPGQGTCVPTQVNRDGWGYYTYHKHMCPHVILFYRAKK